MARMRGKAPDRRGSMVKYKVTRCFEIVAMDVPEISRKSKDSFNKLLVVLVVIDALTRWTLALPLKD